MGTPEPSGVAVQAQVVRLESPFQIAHAGCQRIVRGALGDSAPWRLCVESKCEERSWAPGAADQLLASTAARDPAQGGLRLAPATLEEGSRAGRPSTGASYPRRRTPRRAAFDWRQLPSKKDLAQGGLRLATALRFFCICGAPGVRRVCRRARPSTAGLKPYPSGIRANEAPPQTDEEE